MARQRLLGIQFARGIAALLVAFYHASRMIALPQYRGRVGFHGFFSFGHAGVDFFFVLSGFIIYFVHHSDLGRAERLPRYLWRRVTRIYPSYWLVLGIILIPLLWKHDLALTAPHFLKSFLLLPDSREPLLGVAWTLVHEMMFYAVFALGIINLRLGLVVCVIWITIIASGSFSDSTVSALRVASAIRNVQFIFGITAAYLVLRYQSRFGLWLAALGIAGFLGAGMAEDAGVIGWDSSLGAMIFGGFSAVAIVGIASAERLGQLHIGRTAEFFGGASYLLYLVHPIAIGTAYRAINLSGTMSRLPDWLCIGLAVSFAVALACLLYRWFEQPVQSALRRQNWERWLTRKQPAAP